MPYDLIVKKKAAHWLPFKQISKLQKLVVKKAVQQLPLGIAQLSPESFL